MNIKFHSPVIITKDLDNLKKFYCQQLKLEIDFDFGTCISLKCGISIWQLSSSHNIVKKKGSSYNTEGNKNMELYFETDDFEDTYSKLMEIIPEPKLMHDVIIESWGQKTIRFYDPEENLIEIGETIPCFVKRMCNEGLTKEEISVRTALPMELVESIINKKTPTTCN